jgi:hypothetical protein
MHRNGLLKGAKFNGRHTTVLESAMPKPSLVWCTTAVNPRASFGGFDAGTTGWKMHGIYGEEKQTFASLGRATSLCGLRPRHGWGMDLFIEDPCLRCVAKAMSLGLEIPREIEHKYHQNRRFKDDFNAWKKDPDAYNEVHK